MDTKQIEVTLCFTVNKKVSPKKLARAVEMALRYTMKADIDGAEVLNPEDVPYYRVDTAKEIQEPLPR